MSSWCDRLVGTQVIWPCVNLPERVGVFVLLASTANQLYWVFPLEAIRYAYPSLSFLGLAPPIMIFSLY